MAAPINNLYARRGEMNRSELMNTNERQRRQTPITRILLVDDNSEILEHVAEMLQPDYDVVGKIADGSVVAAEVDRLKPDIVVLDISLGSFSGIEIARQLQNRGFPGGIVFLTVHEGRDFVNAGIGSGGQGYVTKYRMHEDLRPAINAVLANQTFISAPIDTQ